MNPPSPFLHMYIVHVYERERQRPAPPLRGPRRAPGYSKNNPKVLQGLIKALYPLSLKKRKFTDTMITKTDKESDKNVINNFTTF